MNPNSRISSLSCFHTLFLCMVFLLLTACNRESGTPEAGTSNPLFGPGFSCQLSAGVYPNPSKSWVDYPERLNDEADILAMESTLQLTSPDKIYERTAADLLTIRTQYDFLPLVEMKTMPCVSFSTLLIRLDNRAIAKFRMGNYTDWHSLNNHFGISEVSEIGTSNIVRLSFQRKYYIPTLREIYEQASFPGVEYVIPNTIFGISEDVCLENLPEDNSRIYIFRKGEGDCSAGCEKNDYAGFLANEDGTIWYLGSYSTETNTDEPIWFSQRQACRVFL